MLLLSNVADHSMQLHHVYSLSNGTIFLYNIFILLVRQSTVDVPYLRNMVQRSPQACSCSPIMLSVLLVLCLGI